MDCTRIDQIYAKNLLKFRNQVFKTIQSHYQLLRLTTKNFQMNFQLPTPNSRLRFIIFSLVFILVGCNQKSCKNSKDSTSNQQEEKAGIPVDSTAYQKKNAALANGDTTGLWPIKNQPFPLVGAILPFKRIVAYYGNLYSKKMGILGEYPPKEIWKRLNSEVKAWEKVDPTTPVQPAI